MTRDDIEWIDEIPDGKIKHSTYANDYFYDIRGRPGRWCVVRMYVHTGDGGRTRYYPNLSKAGEIFELLTN